MHNGQKTFANLMEIVSEWRQKYHVNKKGELVFQNKRTMANVILSDTAVHTIEKHSRGFDLIPGTIQNPDEIWSRWEDPTKQMVVLRSYISFGKNPYIVNTRDGRITDAFSVSPRAANSFRKGVIL